MEALEALSIGNSARVCAKKIREEADKTSNPMVYEQATLRAQIMLDQADLWYEVADYMKKRFV